MNSKKIRFLIYALILFALISILFENKVKDNFDFTGKTIFKFTDINFLKESSETKNSEFNIEEFIDNYFNVWNNENIVINEDETFDIFSLVDKKRYLENLQSIDKSWIDKVNINSNYKNLNSLRKKAITLRNTNVRLIPSISPIFKDPSLQGEGFPFDYNQNSIIKINTPILVSHLSLDKSWAFVQTYFVNGWIKMDDIAFVDELFINEFKNKNYYISKKEEFHIYNSNYIDTIKISTIFPKKDDKFIIATKDSSSNALIELINIESENISKFPLEFNNENKTSVLKEFYDEPYGWGGYFFHRDCSSFTQDYFSLFGKYLNRNSKAQTKNGEYIDIKKLTIDEKKEFIKNNGVPFSTLIYMKGHIMLYIGIKDNEPLVVHNIWSIKIKNKSNEDIRHIFGKTIISTLEPGKELEGYYEDSNILNKVLGIVIL